MWSYVRIMFLPAKRHRDVSFLVWKVNVRYQQNGIWHHWRENGLKICGIHLQSKNSYLITLSMYRRPSGDCLRFIQIIDRNLKYLHNPKYEFVICDKNTDCVSKSTDKLLTSLMTTFNVSRTVNSATKIQNDSITACANILVPDTKLHESFKPTTLKGPSHTVSFNNHQHARQYNICR